MATQEVIRMTQISKSFGDVRANEHIDLSVNKGEVHAILGENGAGKSTLMNVLSGIYAPDDGDIYLNGERTEFTSPQDAIKAGIGMIYQHFKLVEVMTAWENICAGPGRSFFLDVANIKRDIQRLCDQSGLNVDLNKKIFEMAVSEKQTVEIIKALYRGAETLILDEPTAVLTPQETEKLFQIIQALGRSGKTVIIITHKLNEVMAISDRVTVLRKGKTVATISISDTSEKQLAEMMVGEAIRMEINRVEAELLEPVLEVDNLVLGNKQGGHCLNGLTFSLRGGEILGVAGVAGSGQKQLCEALVGLLPVKAGSIRLNGQDITDLSASTIVKSDAYRLNFVPEDRLGMGLVGAMNIVDNVILKDYHRRKGQILDRRSAAKKADTLVRTLDVQHPGMSYPIKVLSGGNIQKILIGRELAGNPQVLIAAYPLRGLDVGVTHTVIDLLMEQKKRGAGILMIGEDLDVLRQICDRIMVLCDGKLMGTIDALAISKEAIGMMMCGQADECRYD